MGEREENWGGRREGIRDSPKTGVLSGTHRLSRLCIILSWDNTLDMVDRYFFSFFFFFFF